MIVTKDIEQILVGDLAAFMGVERIFVTDDIPEGDVTEERITVHVKELKPETYFSKCFVEVNWCVPDIVNKPNAVRLQEVERQLVGSLESIGEYDGSTYRYEIASHKTLKSDLHCHYVNIRLLFEILNVK